MGNKPSIKISACVLTNGRSTYDYACKSLDYQSVKVKYMTIRDTPMDEAMNRAVNETKSKYILKMDDDFFLHPYAIEYMVKHVSNSPTNGMWFWRLYEIFTKRPVQSIKIYDVNVVKKLGGFRANEKGKIDRNFLHDLQKGGYKVWKEKSMVAIHACAPWDENLRYERIWTSNADESHIKSADKRGKMMRYKVPVVRQFRDVERILDRVNLGYRTHFSNFARRKKRMSK